MQLRVRAPIVAKAILGAAAAAAACQAPSFGSTFEARAPLTDTATGAAAAGSTSDAGSGPPGPTTGAAVADTDSGTADGTGGTGGLSAAVQGTESGSEDGVQASGSGATGLSPFIEIGYEFTTVAYGAKYDPDHVVAVWVERDRAFVRTLEVHADNRRPHLIAWRIASGEDTNDAVTGATIKNMHGTLAGVWDLRDAQGSLVADGDYTIVIEMTGDNSNGNAPAGPVIALPVVVGGPGFETGVPAADGFQDVHAWSQ